MDATARKHVASQLLPVVQQKFTEAKESKSDSANLLRQQLWLLKDMAAGVKTDMAVSEQKKILKEWLPYFGIVAPSSESSSAATESSAPAAAEASTASGLTAGEKRLRTLQKKLAQIQALRERQNSGEKLEKNQIEKLETEGAVRAEIEEVERLIEAATVPLSS